MTYCVGLKINKGLVFMSDTRTNSGIDNISTFQKMHTWSKEGDRVITLLNAGNLATTQLVISLLDERSKAPNDRSPSIFEAQSMFQVAQLVGETLREVIATASPQGELADSNFTATLILGGQISTGKPSLFLIYPEGNFIEASTDTPFFQSGETKYGRPILIRAYEPDLSFEEAVKLLLVSFDSTIKANLSVGLPLDLEIYRADTLTTCDHRRFQSNDPYYQIISNGWGEALRDALKSLPDYSFK